MELRPGVGSERKVRPEVVTLAVSNRICPEHSRGHVQNFCAGYVYVRIGCEKLDIDYPPQPMGQPAFRAGKKSKHWDVQLHGESSVIVSPFQLRLVSAPFDRWYWCDRYCPIDMYEACTRTYPSDVKREIEASPPKVYITQNPLIVNEFPGESVRILLADDDWEDNRAENLTLHRLCDLPGYKEAMQIYQLGEWWLSHLTGDYSERALREGRAP